MKHVVYLLGAGFSAPLGIPVMSNFLAKARDLADNDAESAHLIEKTFATLDRLHIAATYYATNVFNIEEVLSLLEMQGRLQSRAQLADFKRFIRHVIRAYTPEINASGRPTRWPELLLADRPWVDYCAFVCCLHGYEFRLKDPIPASGPAFGSYSVAPKERRSVRYSVITLNYDLVLETASRFLRERWGLNLSFTPESGTPLAKLHGSIDTDTLVPPTWQKTLDQSDVHASWVQAYGILRTANELRILGYSLPESDAYVRYLLKAAVIDTPNLQRIDVLCQDGDGHVRDRYASFVRLNRPNFFQDSDLAGYLGRISSRYSQWPDKIDPDRLEMTHQELFGV